MTSKIEKIRSTDFAREQRLDFGRALRAERERAGYSQARLGKALDVTNSRIGQWENGDPIDPRYAMQLEIVLNLAPGELTRRLGYVSIDAETQPSVIAAIRADSRLDERGRKSLEALYRDQVRASGASS